METCPFFPTRKYWRAYLEKLRRWVLDESLSVSVRTSGFSPLDKIRRILPLVSSSLERTLTAFLLSWGVFFMSCTLTKDVLLDNRFLDFEFFAFFLLSGVLKPIPGPKVLLAFPFFAPWLFLLPPFPLSLGTLKRGRAFSS